MLNEWLASPAATAAGPLAMEIKKLVPFARAYLQNLKQYNKHREAAWPWSLNPAAWRARYGRNQARRQMSEIYARVINHAKSLAGAPARTA